MKYPLSDRQKKYLVASNQYDKAVIGNGCRPEFLSKVLPDSIEKPLSPFFDLEFRDPCTIHDVLYRIGGTERDRRAADVHFRLMMNNSVKYSTRFSSPVFRSLETTRWYQIKWKNIKRGVMNIGTGVKKGFVNTGIGIKKQYLKLKVRQYYFLVRQFGESSFNFKNPFVKFNEFPSFDENKNKNIKEDGFEIIWFASRWWFKMGSNYKVPNVLR